MTDGYIIEVTVQNKTAFITEREGNLYSTSRREEATVFPSKLDAMCAFVYIEDRYQPRLAPCS